MNQLNVELFANNLKQLVPLFPSETFLIACSGGLDSVVLTHLMASLDCDFAIAHINYQLRTNDSEADQQFCKNLAEQYNVPFFTKNFETKALKKSRESIQMLCRKLRYDFFEEIRQTSPYQIVLTAHHADDDIESLLMNLMRGNGLAGLSGILAENKHIIRPLLPFYKEEIKEYAQRHQLEWREDYTNSESVYDRNFVRNELIPLIEGRMASSKKNIHQSLLYLKEISNSIERDLNNQKPSLFKPYSSGYKINIENLMELEDFKLHYYFQPFGFQSVKELKKIFNAETSSKLESKDFILHKDRDFIFLISKDIKTEETPIKITGFPFEITHPLPFKISANRVLDPQANAVLDADKVDLPLYLRHPKEGDIFRPNQKSGSKKLSKFLRDKKIPNFEKKMIWLLTDAKDRILYVIPFQTNDEFGVTEGSKNYLNIYL